MTTRLAIDHLRSARVRRESYVGPWLADYGTIAAVVDKSEATRRQIAARARRRVAVPEPRFEPSHEVVQEVHGVVNPDKLAHLGPVLPLAYGRRQRDRTGSAEQEEGHEDDHN